MPIISGGGSSGGSSSFTETVTITPQADTPALQASQVGGAEAAEFIADPDSGTAALVKVLSKAGNGIRLIDQFGGIQAAPDPETPFASLSAGADSGQTSNVLECWDNDFNNVVLATTPAGAVMMPHLPTADPHAVGQLWNASGVLTISAG